MARKKRLTAYQKKLMGPIYVSQFLWEQLKIPTGIISKKDGTAHFILKPSKYGGYEKINLD